MLKVLIPICELYAADVDVKFNGAKSKYIVIKGRNCDVFNIDRYVNGDVVAKVTSADHLGHHISSVNNTSMIQAAEAQFWKSFNLFLANFGHGYSAVKNKLFKQFYYSFYALTLWSLHGNECSKICIAWRKL